MKPPRAFAYPARLEPGSLAGITVSFRDVPEAITEGSDTDEARRMAAGALGTALLAYLGVGRPLPEASAVRRGEVLVALPADVAARLARRATSR